MTVSQEYVNYVLDQLAGVPGIVTRRMFSGVGIYSDEVFFAVIFQDQLYFKTDDASRQSYLDRGMSGFRTSNVKVDLKMNYYTVPAEILEDAEELREWARRAVVAAIATRGPNSKRLLVRKKTARRGK